MAILRKTLLATSLIGAGLMGTTGMAVAQEQEGLANVDDTQTTTPLEACNNNVPTNVLGVQVPVQDAAGDLSAASGDEDGKTGQTKACGQDTDAQT